MKQTNTASLAARMLADKGRFPSGGSVPFDVARDLIAQALRQHSAGDGTVDALKAKVLRALRAAKRGDATPEGAYTFLSKEIDTALSRPTEAPSKTWKRCKGCPSGDPNDMGICCQYPLRSEAPSKPKPDPRFPQSNSIAAKNEGQVFNASEPPADVVALLREAREDMAMCVAEMSTARGRLETLAGCNEDRRIADALGSTCDHLRRRWFDPKTRIDAKLSEQGEGCEHDWRYSGTDSHGSHKNEDLYVCRKCSAREYQT